MSPSEEPQTLASAPGGDARRLVLGAAVGFGVDESRVFVESLRGCGYRGDITLLVRWPGLKLTRYLRSRGVEVIRLVQIRSFSRSVHARRYAIYLAHLAARAERYDQVMLSDVRDVVFQRHPFDGIASPKCHFFLEGASRTVGDDPTNSRWAHGCLTTEEAAALAKCRISCSGITIGGTAAIIAYLRRMAARIAAQPFRIYRTIGHGYDQAIHNALVHLDPAIDGIIVENNRHIATMALEPRSFYRLDDEARVHAPDGALFAICHQYDRFPDIRDAVAARYGAEDA